MDKIIEHDCREYIERIDLSPLAGKTVLITGANGLIGTYLVYMLHLANEIYCSDIKIVAVSRSSPNKALSGIFTDRYRFYSMDLLKMDSADLPEKIDYIIHGATYAQPGKFLRNFTGTVHLNTTVTEKLLKKAGSDGARFLFLSSSEVYGQPENENIPTPEEYPGNCSPVGIRAIYSEAKRMGETLCFAYRNFENVNAVVARISMTYGPGVKMEDERVLAQFIKQAVTQKKIAMLDDGSKERTFCYVADCALMLLHVLIYGSDFVYNVGGKDRITIRELAEQICDLTGSTLSAEAAQIPSQKNVKVSPQRVELDIKKVCTEFGLDNFTSLSDGLKQTIKWNIED